MTRIYVWLQRHPTHVDGVVAGAFVLFGLLMIGHAPGWWSFAPLLIAAPIVVRRKYPVAVFWTIIAIGAFQVLSPAYISISDFAVPVALYSLAAYRPRKHSLIGLTVCLFGAGVAIARIHPTGEHASASIALWGFAYAVLASPMVIAWVAGDSMQYRRSYYVELEEKALRLERERDQQAQIAAATERARIARELHDVVAHNVSVMVVQAEGAAYAMDSAPENTRKALGAIADTGRSALVEMRRLLGVLRAQDVEAERAPQPGIDQLEDLLEQVRTTGVTVEFKIEGVPVELPQGVALAAYRIVQESLTNARKHGGPSVSACVGMHYNDQELRLRVQDNGRGAKAPTDGQGNGLAGMRERVALFGGQLNAGPLVEGGFQVEAVLPYESARVLQ
ncbi:sensor histidine kinase [Actinospica sp.]|uniref:sensor histidine kinase n=1 Tax=Actinospica sp. TaxID=1872142 RepID=UPI002CCCCE72|nr:sensor histidine kinase [Actinospica sp.]HWG23728.1 sensor histidine kinase [Actinospica sp.]